MRRFLVFSIATGLLFLQAPVSAYQSPTLLYCSAVNDQPSPRTAFARMENGWTFAGVFHDPTTGTDVQIPGGSFFGNDPRSIEDGFWGPTVRNFASMTSNPRLLDATIVNDAWAAPGENGFVNTSSGARTWFVLRGARGPVSLRADVAFQATLYGDGPEIDGDGSSFFTHGVAVVSHPTDLLADSVIAMNGRAQPAWAPPCGGWDVHGTIPDTCVLSDGTPHELSWVVRSNPFAVVPDVPFRLSIGLNAAAIASPFSDPVHTYVRFDRAALAHAGDFPATPGLSPEGFVADLDGAPDTRDVQALAGLGYSVEALPDPATLLSASETSHSSTTVKADVVARSVSATLVAAGALDGSVVLSAATLATIDGGDFAGKGFFTSDWSGILGGVAHRGVWRGFADVEPDGTGIRLRGVVSGSIDATAEGVLTESVPGSGVFDRLTATWALGDVSGQPSGGRVDVSGESTVGTAQRQRSTPLEIEQLFASGTTTGDAAGPIDVTATAVRIVGPSHPLAGQGFAVLSYRSSAGAGAAWAHASDAMPGVASLGGMADGPLRGILHVALDTSGALHAIGGYRRRTDLGLPPMADVEVRTWGMSDVSPGDTFTITLEATNRGRTAASSVQLVERLSQLVDYVSSSAGGAYDPATHLLTFQLGTLAPGARVVRTVRARAQWGLLYTESTSSQAFVGASSAEIDAFLSPSDTALTPEWWALQIGHGNDWDARIPPPGFDPSKPEWSGLQPDSLKQRVEQGIALAKQRDPRWGEYLQHLYDHGKIHVDLDLDSSQWNGAVGHLYLNGHDVGWSESPALQIDDARWGAEAFSQARGPNLSGILIHEGRHSDGQTIPGSEKGEMQAFAAEGAHHLNVLDQLVRAGRYDDARALLDHMDARWVDLGFGRQPPLGVKAETLSLQMQARLTEILLLINTGRYNEALRKIAEVQGQLLQISTSRNDPLHNGSESASFFWVAWDPNAMYGPEGPVSRGETLHYRVEFENVGKGRAYGVFVEDELPASLDEATLAAGEMRDVKTGAVVAPAGVYDPATRTIRWTVGTVASGAGGTAEVSAAVRSDAADGTEIVNYATIYFPSVPQELRTNSIVSVVTPPRQVGEPTYGPLHLWAGLRNSDDEGTGFDLRAELRAEGELIAAGDVPCISGLKRNPDKAKAVAVPLAPTAAGATTPASGAELSLTLLARIGTNPDGTRCPKTSHSNARGLRILYDGGAQRSSIALGLGAATQELYLRLSGAQRMLDADPPTAAKARHADSAGVRLVRGNRWMTVGTWGYAAP